MTVEQTIKSQSVVALSLLCMLVVLVFWFEKTKRKHTCAEFWQESQYEDNIAH